MSTGRKRRMRDQRTIQALAALALLILAALIDPGPVAADGPGPTDYRTEVVALGPAGAGKVQVAILGGDRFVSLGVISGVQVTVVGYEGEPFLRFDADGAVYRNERSPSRWPEGAELPDGVSAQALPQWVRVSSDGTYVWSDRRTRSTDLVGPEGAVPGQVVSEGSIPLVVDGRNIEVRVRTLLLAPPPLWPVVAGIALGAFLVALAGATHRRRVLAGVIALWATAAAVTGLWAFLSVPATTGPSMLLWLPPVVAALAALGAMALSSTVATRRAAVTVLLVVAGFELLSWSWHRRAALFRALIPSDAPPALDRAVIAGGFVLGLVALVWALVAAARPAVITIPSAASVSGRRPQHRR